MAQKPFVIPRAPTALDFSREQKQEIMDRLNKEIHARLTGSQGSLSLLEPNWEVTARLQKEPKYVKFNEWCAKYGVVAPSLEWPVAYGPKGELVGVRAKTDIGPCQSYVYVPVNLTLNEEQFKRSLIAEIYDNIIDEYNDRDNCDHFILIFFVAYQMTLGEKSFWHPYF